MVAQQLDIKMTEMINSDTENFAITDSHIDALLSQGFCVLEQACSADLFRALVQESQQLQAEFKQARIAQGVQQQAIRGDCTRWLNSSDPAGSRYLQCLEKLAQHLNQQLYSGIRQVEAHYASYAVGDYYARHRDNPAQQQSRVFSTVLYLNLQWQAAWQGELQLQDIHLQWHKILPMPNRLVLFQSDLLHEVCAATQQRNSIAGWLRRDTGLF